MPEDGRERHPPPIHLLLTQEDDFPRSIQLSVRHDHEELDSELPEEPAEPPSSSPDPNIGRGSSMSTYSETNSCSPTPSVCRLGFSRTAIVDAKFPRIAFALRLKDTLQPSELSKDLFKEWLRTIPAMVEEVKVEAGFDSFSSLVIISLPIAMSLYVPKDPAVMCLGPITSPNRILEATILKTLLPGTDSEELQQFGIDDIKAVLAYEASVLLQELHSKPAFIYPETGASFDPTKMETEDDNIMGHKIIRGDVPDDSHPQTMKLQHIPKPPMIEAASLIASPAVGREKDDYWSHWSTMFPSTIKNITKLKLSKHAAATAILESAPPSFHGAFGVESHYNPDMSGYEPKETL